MAQQALPVTTAPRTITVRAANPKACGNNGRGTVLSQDVINVRFSTLGVFDDTQTIPLGDEAVYMTGPAGNSC